MSNLNHRRNHLRKMRFLALFLLIFALAGLILSEYLGAEGGWGWVKAFCEASAIGGLADWFAVVALFRRPMGLPIPHTAILPRKKQEIGESLAGFVYEKFLHPDVLITKVEQFEFGIRFGHWLSDDRHVWRLVSQVSHLWRDVLQKMEGSRMERFMIELIGQGLKHVDISDFFGRWLDVMTHDGRHQQLLDLLLSWMAERLDDQVVKDYIFRMIVAAIEKESKWARAANKMGLVDLLSGIATERLPDIIERIQEMMRDPDHPYRLAFEDKLAGFVDRLQADESTRSWVNARVASFLESEAFQQYAKRLGHHGRQWVIQDLEKEDSMLGHWGYAVLHNWAERLTEDARMREEIDRLFIALAQDLIPDVALFVTKHIATTVAEWDEPELIEELELSLGPDLQYIRFNGALVGGVAGLVLHGLLFYLLPLL